MKDLSTQMPIVMAKTINVPDINWCYCIKHGNNFFDIIEGIHYTASQVEKYSVFSDEDFEHNCSNGKNHLDYPVVDAAIQSYRRHNAHLV